jgi:hypothetical protein
MKNLFRAALLVSFLSLATACGGPVNDAAADTEDLTSNFDPVAQFAQVQKTATAYTKNVVAVSLNGTRQAHASTSQSSCTSFAWVWTVMGSDGVFVDVQINSSSVKVLKHEKRFLFTGQATFDPTKVLVDGRDLLVLAGSLNMGQPTNVTLGSTLAAQVTGPRYSVTFPSNGYMTIDGVTGQERK